ncbi:type II toxin-antitoxin system toxin ribonuclease C26 [Glycomyces endophyticus]|uniref:Type II toxin-antitoxin system toxin ribonuclease C26 n=1 Tax=Glycomyces endophyticus TaxID=480996 RepID=A0ABN2GIT6_9ACTN
MIIIADTSALLAAFDPEDEYFTAASEMLRTERMAISPLVMTELDHLVRRDYGFDFAQKVCEDLINDFHEGVHQLAQIAPDDFTVAHKVRDMYAALELDLADTIGVALAAKYRTNRIFTLDQRDFRTITPLTEAFDHFEILPIDR